MVGKGKLYQRILVWHIYHQSELGGLSAFDQDCMYGCINALPSLHQYPPFGKWLPTNTNQYKMAVYQNIYNMTDKPICP
jgi:hypothetical protein